MKTAIVASTIWAPTTTPRAASSNGTAGSTVPCAPGATQFLHISEPLPVDLCVYRGDSGRFRVDVTDATTGLPLDVSAATWDCDIRSVHDSETVIATLDVNPVDANTVEVVLDPVTSAILVDGSVWDLEMTLNSEVTTLITGVIHVAKDVSRP